MKRFLFILTVSILFSLLVTGMAPYPGSLAPMMTYYVDTTVDSNAAGYQACTVAANDCSLRGAIILSNSTFSETDVIYIPAGTYTLTETVSTGYDQSYGDLDIGAPVVIEGAETDTTIIQAGSNSDNGIDRVLEINLNGYVSISNLTIRYGKITSSPGGAGIYQSSGSGNSVGLYHVAVTDNKITSSVAGGGILTKGTMDILESTIMDNNTYGDGGGIFSDAGSHLTITRSTIANNYGGVGGGLNGNDWILLRNVTIYHNSASFIGPGIFLWNNGMMTMYHVTVANNFFSLSSGGSGMALDSTCDLCTTYVYNSILAVNGAGSACKEGVNTSVSNISTDSSCGTGFTVTNPLLADILMDNGGYTDTVALLRGSPAIDGGDNSYTLEMDQRGITRPLDGDGDGMADCDIGAFEAYPVEAFMPLVRKP